MVNTMCPWEIRNTHGKHFWMDLCFSRQRSVTFLAEGNTKLIGLGHGIMLHFCPPNMSWFHLIHSSHVFGNVFPCPNALSSAASNQLQLNSWTQPELSLNSAWRPEIWVILSHTETPDAGAPLGGGGGAPGDEHNMKNTRRKRHHNRIQSA